MMLAIRSVAAVALVSVALGVAARADVKVVSRMSGGPTAGAAAQSSGGGGRSGTVTTFYKGNKIRMEGNSGRGSITIIDGDAGKMYLLNPTRKTYLARPLGTPPGLNRMMAAMEIKTQADVTPIAKARTIVGKPAKGYAYKATIAMSMKAGQGPNGAGPGGKAGAQPLGTIQLTGEQWVTSAVKLPGNGNAMQAFVRMGSGGGGGMPGLKPLMDKFAQIKGLPLSSTQNITATGMMAMGMGGGGASSGGGPARGGMRMSNEAVSLSEAPLPASLFAIPAGYRQEEAPTMPGGVR
jgi:hypothetical protein